MTHTWNILSSDQPEQPSLMSSLELRSGAEIIAIFVGTNPRNTDHLRSILGLSDDELTRFREVAPNLSSIAELNVEDAVIATGLDAAKIERAHTLALELLANPEIFATEMDRVHLNTALRQMALPEETLDQLRGTGLLTLADVRQKGKTLAQIEGLLPEQVARLSALANLAIISPDLDLNTRLIDAGMTSPLQLATNNLETLAADLAIEPETLQPLAERANTYRGMVLSSLTAARLALSPTYASLDLYRPERETLASFRDIATQPVPTDACTTCHTCESALSPGAYLVDLIDFLRDSFPTAFQTLDDFERRFFRPFKPLNLGCEGIERKVRQIDIANEVLLAFVQSRRPGLTRAALYAEFRTVPGYPRPRVLEYMFDAYLAEMGTSRAEVEAANAPERRTALVERLGLTEADLASLNRPDPALITLSDVEALPDLLRRGKEKGIDPTDPRQLPALHDARARAAAAIGRVQDAWLPDVRANLIHAALQLRGDLYIAGEPSAFLVNNMMCVYASEGSDALAEVSKSSAATAWVVDIPGIGIHGRPSVVLLNNTICVFTRLDNKLYVAYKNAVAPQSPWETRCITDECIWDRLPLELRGDPIAVVSQGELSVFAYTRNAAGEELLGEFRATLPDSDWYGFEIEMELRGGIGAVVVGNSTYVYGFGDNGNLREAFRLTPATSWIVNEVSDVAGAYVTGAPVPIPVGNAMHVYVQGDGGQLLEFYTDPNTPWQVLDLRAIAGGPLIVAMPTPLLTPGDLMHVYVLGDDGMVWEYYKEPATPWQVFDAPSSQPGGIWVSGALSAILVNNTIHLYAAGDSGQLWEFYKEPTTNWQAFNLSIGLGGPLVRNVKELGNLLYTDLMMDACAVTTRVQDAIEAIQSLVQAYQLGRITLSLATPRADFDDRWRWMQSYGSWHAAQMVFFHPENFLLPSIRRSQTPQFRSLLEEIRGEPTPSGVREKVAEYQNSMVRKMVYGHSVFYVGMEDRFYLIFAKEATLDVVEQASTGEWIAWTQIDNLPANAMLGAVNFNDRIYLFFSKEGNPKTLQYTWLIPDQLPSKPDLTDTSVPVPAILGNVAFVSGVNNLTIYFQAFAGTTFEGWRMDRFHRWYKTIPPSPIEPTGSSDLLKGVGHLNGKDYLIYSSGSRILLCETSDPYGPDMEWLGEFSTPRIRSTWTVIWDFGLGGFKPVGLSYAGIVQNGQLVVAWHTEQPKETRFTQFAPGGALLWVSAGGDIAAHGVSIIVKAETILLLYGIYIDTTGFAIVQFNGSSVQKLVRGSLVFQDLSLVTHPIHQPEGELYDYRSQQQQVFSTTTRDDFGRLILNEWYFYIPLAAASVLGEAKQYYEAMVWLNIVYHPFIANRQIYYGLSQPTDSQLDPRESALWQRDPFDPYRVARARSGAFLRHTIYQHVENLLDWADAEFARDTRESINRARKLYELAEDLLLAGGISPDNCAAAWNELYLELDTHFSSTDAKLLRLILDPLQSLDGHVTRSDITQLRSIVTSNDTVDERIQDVKQYADQIAARPRPDRSLETLLREQETCGLQTIGRAAGVFSASLPSVGIYYELFGNGASRRGETAVALSTALKIGCGFCIPANPILDTLRFRIETNLAKIRSCHNPAGMRRSLRASALVDPLGAIQQAAADEELDELIPTEPPPLFRFSYLIERARYYVQVAQQLESQLLNAFEREDTEKYSLMKARQDMRIAKATLDLQDLRVTEANDQVILATLQRDRAQFQANHFQELLTGDLLGWENTALILQLASASQLAYAAAVKTGLAIAAGIATRGAAALPMSVEAAITGASATSAFATWQLQIASFERRKQEWMFQRDLAQRDTAIGGQSITLANDRLNITNQERDIADLQNQFANEVVNFLGAKFTNRQLWEWMGRTLRRYLREHLNMSTITARMAQTALAFERQEPITIVASYYADRERRDLLTAEQLLTDINRLDQHRLTTQKRAKELTKTISLAAVAPVEFEGLRQNGWFEFTTLLDWFDRDFPGHYLRLIKNVSLTIIAIVPPGEAIHVTLSNNGISRVMVGTPYTQLKEIQRQPESVAITTASNGTGLFEVRLDDPILLPFEGSGVETTWRLEMPKGANHFDFTSLIDVLFTIRYTAHDDPAYRERVLKQMGIDQNGKVAVGGTTSFSLSQSFPDAWYLLNNPPRDIQTPYGLEFEVRRRDFPPNELDHRMTRLNLAFRQERPVVVPLALEYQPRQPNGSFGAVYWAEMEYTWNPEANTGSPISLGALEDAAGTTVALNTLPAFGRWVLRLRYDADRSTYPDFFQGVTGQGVQTRLDLSWLQDALFVITYDAAVEYKYG